MLGRIGDTARKIINGVFLGDRSGFQPNGCAHAGDQLAMASLRDSEVIIGPVLPEDLAALFVWINDADAAASICPTGK